MSSPLTLGRTADLVTAIGDARRIDLDAFVLRNPLLLFALERAATRGAEVNVRLGDPLDASQRKGNADAMTALSSAGASVTIEPGYGPESLHDKIANVDGVLYLDDRNFTGEQSETVLIDSRAPQKRRYTQIKADALAQEARLIATGKGDNVIVSTEALGEGPVADALIARAKRGDNVRVMYDPATHDPGAQFLTKLRRAGVMVRSSSQRHKIAVAGDGAWIGSANASPGNSSTREWGAVVPRSLAAPLRDMLEYCWSTAKAAPHAAHSSVHGDPGA